MEAFYSYFYKIYKKYDYYISQIKWKNIIREHILTRRQFDFDANVKDIYLVAFVAETHGVGRNTFLK